MSRTSLFLILLCAYIFGWFVGFLSTRSALKEKYRGEHPQMGILKVVYDSDDPSHPQMGLEIESLNYILNHEELTLEVIKIGFPDVKNKVVLESKKLD